MDKSFKPTNEYVARKPCGCVVGLMAVIPGRERETAKEVAAWIRDGLTVTYISRDSDEFTTVIDHFGETCPKCQVEKQDTLFGNSSA